MGKRLYSKRRQIVRTLLKETRLSAGLTQKVLSGRLKRHQSYVSDYERGHKRLDYVAVEEVLIACGTRIDAFTKEYLDQAAQSSD